MLAVADNGSATRNRRIYAGQLGLNMAVMTGRTYHSNDKPYVERPFGTLQWQVLNFLPGYTGSRPGELSGADPIAAAALSPDGLYGTITRYLVDEYPFQPHRGTGMFGATPMQKMLEVYGNYGEVDPPNQGDRRLHLGIKRVASTTSEGVKIFNIPYNSTELQRFASGASKRVTVHLDPDDLRKVSITAEGHQDVIEADLKMTAFSDLTLEEALTVMEEAVKGNPHMRALHDANLWDARARRAKESGFFPDSTLPASYRGLDDLEKRADALAQVELVPNTSSGPTVPPGSIMDRSGHASAQPVDDMAAAAPHQAKRHDKVAFKPIKESKL